MVTILGLSGKKRSINAQSVENVKGGSQMSVQTTMFEEKKAVRIVCERCGAAFVMYPETVQDFYEVHGCYQET